MNLIVDEIVIDNGVIHSSKCLISHLVVPKSIVLECIINILR